MGAAISFYAVFSIIPFLIIILIVVAPFLGQGYIQNAIVEQIRFLINSQAADFIQTILTGLHQTKLNFFAIVVSGGTLIVGALGVFYELKNSLDDLWDTGKSTKETQGWKYFFSSRLLSLSLVPILAFLLIMTLIFSELTSYLSGYSPLFGNITYLFQIGTFIFSFLVLNFLFMFIYRFLPQRNLPWNALVRGAFVTTFLFMIGKFVIDLYVTELASTSIFGAAGAFAVLLLWVYYSVQIFLFGASLTYVYSRRYSHLKHT